jgi:YD repeat-containing protein
MRAFSRRTRLTAGILLGALLAVAPSPGPVQADDPRHRLEAGPSTTYRYDGDGRLERVERRRDRSLFRYDGDGALTGADRLAPRTRPRDGTPPDRPRPGTPKTDAFAPDTPQADLFTYDGEGDLTGAARRFPNLPDDRAPSAREPSAPARK